MRNYTDEPLGSPAPAPQAPEPGTGTVFVQEDDEGTWYASWQSESGIDWIEGVSEDEAKAWASGRDAEAVLVFDTEADDYKPL